MTENRRKFIISSGLAAGGAVVNGLAASRTPQASPQDEMADVIGRYGSVLQNSTDQKGGTRLQVKLRDRRQMAEVYSDQATLPFDLVRTNESNEFEIEHRGIKFTISHIF